VHAPGLVEVGLGGRAHVVARQGRLDLGDVLVEEPAEALGVVRDAIADADVARRCHGQPFQRPVRLI
jgi:hypothetical protein